MRALGSVDVTSETTTLATCWKLTLTDSPATVLGFTNHDKDLTVSGVTYAASTGYTPTQITTTGALNVDNLDVIGLLDSTGITAGDIAAGKYDGAEVEIFLVDWTDTSAGAIKLRKGWTGNIIRQDSRYIAEVRGLTQRLQQGIIEQYSTQCRADLGDSRCKIRLDPPEWTANTAYTVRVATEGGSGSVVKPTTDNGRHYKCTVAGTSNDTEGEPSWNTTIGGTTIEADGVQWETLQALTRTDTVASVTDAANFAGTNLDEADDYWNLGKLTWTSGNNSGRSMEVKDYTLSGKGVELYLPMPDAITAGDTYTIQTGCNKDMLTHCKTKFDNLNNNRSEIYVPGVDAMISQKGTQ